MNKIRAIIIDDEAHARLALRGIITEELQHVEVIDEAKNLPDGVKLIHKHKPDVVLLDIEMPSYSGLQILDFFNTDDIDFKIVFVTAYSQYALNAFQLSAIDYLVKPVQYEDLLRAFSKVQPTAKENMIGLSSLLSNEVKKKIVLNSNGVQELLELDNIMYIKADGSYCDVVLCDKKICVTKRLSEFDKLEELGPFLRIHRSHLININFIKKISKADGGSVFMSDHTELSISKEKRPELEKMLKLINL
jgi:two-component system LytT family response regulator